MHPQNQKNNRNFRELSNTMINLLSFLFATFFATNDSLRYASSILIEFNFLRIELIRSRKSQVREIILKSQESERERKAIDWKKKRYSIRVGSKNQVEQKKNKK